MVSGFRLQVGEGAVERFVCRGGGEVGVLRSGVLRGAPAETQLREHSLAGDGNVAARLSGVGRDFGGRIGGHFDFSRWLVFGVFAARDG